MASSTGLGLTAGFMGASGFRYCSSSGEEAHAQTMGARADAGQGASIGRLSAHQLGPAVGRNEPVACAIVQERPALGKHPLGPKDVGGPGLWPIPGPFHQELNISGASIFQSHKTASNTASGGPSHHAKISHGGCGFHSGLGRTLRARISIPSLQDGSLGGAVRHSVNSTRRYFVPIRLFAAAT